MAGTTEEPMDTTSTQDDALASWIKCNNKGGSSALLTLCDEEEQLRRALSRIDRSGSTESVGTTSGVDSCNSGSEPGSPCRPVTPMPPGPTHLPYDECLRGDSEDSGLGPSPAKSNSIHTPGSPVSPIQFRCGSDDSLLELSPRTDNSYESEDNPKTDFYDDDEPKSPSAFKFLLSKSSSPDDGFQETNFQLPNTQRMDSDFQQSEFHQMEDPFRCGTTTTNQQTKFPTETDFAAFRCCTTTTQQTKSDNADITKFPILTTETDFAAFRCGTTTTQQATAMSEGIDDHTFRSKQSLDHSEEDSPSSFFDEQARQQQDNSGSSNLSDKLSHHFSQVRNQKDSSATSTLTDNDHRHFSQVHHEQDTSGSSTLTDKLNHHFLQNHLNPKVVLIRSNFSGHGYAEDSSSSRQFELTGSDCTSSNCSQAGGSVDTHSASGSSQVEDGACKWLNCERSADANTTATDLVDHIRQCHVREQSDDDKSFVCLWVGCKVYDRPSCSRSWLERHVLLHGGSKPFRCIVDGCHQRFSSEVVLERHVNSHFPQRTKLNANHCRRKSRHKHRKRPTSNKSKDFFDDAAMEHVRHNLLMLSSVDGMNCGGPPSAITFRSNVIGRRVDSSGKVNVLLHWNPEDMLPDTWIPESEILSNLEKTIPVCRLPPKALQLPSMSAFAKTGIVPARPGKRKRK